MFRSSQRFHTSPTYQLCVRCVQDTSTPGITFDSSGVCFYCHLHDQLCRAYPNEGPEGRRALAKLIDSIKTGGAGKPYDCVIGVSGGRDSSFLLHLAKKEWGLRPLAVHFNDGFDNPVGGENMIKQVRHLGVELRTITSDWRLAKDLKITELKASTPLMNSGTDVGIGASLYGVAAKEGIKHILFGQSFRTEGLKPLCWAYFDGDYLRAIHKRFGRVEFPPWEPTAPGYSLGVKELAYYLIVKGIRVLAPLYNYPYVRREAEEIMARDFGWVYPGAHYFDDLYWALISHVQRIKFGVDIRRTSYAALVRSGQMERRAALEALEEIYVIEDEDVIRLCIDRLGITRDEFDEYMRLPPRNFTDYPNSLNLLNKVKYPIWVLCRLGFLPLSVYDKWFGLGSGLENQGALERKRWRG